MPVDLMLTWDTQLQGCKLTFVDNDLATTKSWLPAVLVSLFTDARASADDPLPDPSSDDRRGWWGDSLNTTLPGDRVGSKLWLLEREKNINTALKRAKTYVEESLAWMVAEGIAKSVKAETEAQTTKDSGTIILAFRVTIIEPDGAVTPLKFEQEWKAVADGI